MVYNKKYIWFDLKFYYVIKLQWQRKNYDTENKLGFVSHTNRTYVYETNITEFTIQYRRSQNFFFPPKISMTQLASFPLGLDAPVAIRGLVRATITLATKFEVYIFYPLWRYESRYKISKMGWLG